MTHVPNCRKCHCNELHKLITILLKYRLSFTVLFNNFPITSHCFHHWPVSLSTIYASFAVCPNLQRQYLKAENIWTTTPALPQAPVIHNGVLFKTIMPCGPSRHYNCSYWTTRGVVSLNVAYMKCVETRGAVGTTRWSVVGTMPCTVFVMELTELCSCFNVCCNELCLAFVTSFVTKVVPTDTKMERRR
jgi:hypothetical protein